MKDICTKPAGRRASIFAALSCVLLVIAGSASAQAATGVDVQARLTTDVAGGRPVVVHVVVALCDNRNQGIVPVEKSLGNGQDPPSNLYWGAMYGVRTYLPGRGGWAMISTPPPNDERILSRAVFSDRVPRDGVDARVYIVADAWDGAHAKPAIQAFLEMSAGRGRESVRSTGKSGELVLPAGGAAHLIVFVGHNGLMDFSLSPPTHAEATNEARSAVVLACSSREYFLDHLNAAAAHPLLLTTGLMAPEAYTLDAAVRAWITDGSTPSVREAAAQAYNRYQKCGLSAARGLFWGSP